MNETVCKEFTSVETIQGNPTYLFTKCTAEVQNLNYILT